MSLEPDSPDESETGRLAEWIGEQYDKTVRASGTTAGGGTTARYVNEVFWAVAG